MWGVRETEGGRGSDPARPPSHVGLAAPPGGLRRLKHPPGSKKTTERGSLNNQQVVEDAWEQREDARGCINTRKL